MEEKYFKLLRLIGGDEPLVGEASTREILLTSGPRSLRRHPAVESGVLVLTFPQPPHHELGLGQCRQDQEEDQQVHHPQHYRPGTDSRVTSVGQEVADQIKLSHSGF